MSSSVNIVSLIPAGEVKKSLFIFSGCFIEYKEHNKPPRELPIKSNLVKFNFSISFSTLSR